jgi:hypothetical protein
MVILQEKNKIRKEYSEAVNRGMPGDTMVYKGKKDKQ